jgi:hypothetical protein
MVTSWPALYTCRAWVVSRRANVRLLRPFDSSLAALTMAPGVPGSEIECRRERRTDARLGLGSIWRAMRCSRKCSTAAIWRRGRSSIGSPPLPFPAFWLAALASLGEPVDWSLPLLEDDGLA